MADQPTHHLEFTVEPFVEGQPGPHVTAAIAAAEALGATVEFGPFGTGCNAAGPLTPEIVAAVTRAALDNGASHITITVTAGTGTGGDRSRAVHPAGRGDSP